MVIFGIVYLHVPSYKKLLKWSLELSGVKPSITSKTLVVGKINGVLLIIAGLVFIFIGMNFESFLEL